MIFRVTTIAGLLLVHAITAEGETCESLIVDLKENCTRLFTQKNCSCDGVDQNIKDLHTVGDICTMEQEGLLTICLRIKSQPIFWSNQTFDYCYNYTTCQDPNSCTEPFENEFCGFANIVCEINCDFSTPEVMTIMLTYTENTHEYTTILNEKDTSPTGLILGIVAGILTILLIAITAALVIRLVRIRDIPEAQRTNRLTIDYEHMVIPSLRSPVGCYENAMNASPFEQILESNYQNEPRVYYNNIISEDALTETTDYINANSVIQGNKAMSYGEYSAADAYNEAIRTTAMNSSSHVSAQPDDLNEVVLLDNQIYGNNLPIASPVESTSDMTVIDNTFYTQ